MEIAPRNWEETFRAFLESGYDCVGWTLESSERTRAFHVSASRSKHLPDFVSLFRRGNVIYMIRNDIATRFDERSPEKMVELLPQLASNFLAAEWDLAGLLLTWQDAPTILEMSNTCCEGRDNIRSALVKRALWHIDPTKQKPTE